MFITSNIIRHNINQKAAAAHQSQLVLHPINTTKPQCQRGTHKHVFLKNNRQTYNYNKIPQYNCIFVKNQVSNSVKHNEDNN